MPSSSRVTGCNRSRWTREIKMVPKKLTKQEEYMKKRMKGRTWATMIELKDDNILTIWEFAELQVKKCIKAIEYSKREIRLAEWCESNIDNYGKLTLPKEFNKTDFPHITNYLKGEWDIQGSIEAGKKTIKKNQWEQKFYTYIYNEYPVEKVAKYKNKLIESGEQLAEEAFEDEDNKHTYHIWDNDGIVRDTDREQGYIEIMNCLKENREEREHIFNMYAYGVMSHGRKQRD